MSALMTAPKVWKYPAIVVQTDEESNSDAKSVHVYNDQGVVNAFSWLPPHVIQSHTGKSVVGQVTVAELPSNENGRQFVIVNFEHENTVPLLQLIPETVCPIEGVVGQVCFLIEDIQHPALRQFVSDALSLNEAFPCFWTCPASIRDHHAYAGGLAKHSLEVATMVASATAMPVEQRDIGIAFALLHDFGKIWSYHEGSLTKEAHLLGHEKVGYNHLAKPLSHLLASCQETGLTMQALLGGEWRNTARRHPLAIGRVVNAFDQLSCEQTRLR